MAKLQLIRQAVSAGPFRRKGVTGFLVVAAVFAGQHGRPEKTAAAGAAAMGRTTARSGW